MIKNNILETIGHTPLVRINNLFPNKLQEKYKKIISLKEAFQILE